MNTITMTLQVDHLILEALKEDISSEDVSTNAVMKEYVKGEVLLQDWMYIAGSLNCWMIRRRQNFTVKTAMKSKMVS